MVGTPGIGRKITHILIRSGGIAMFRISCYFLGTSFETGNGIILLKRLGSAWLCTLFISARAMISGSMKYIIQKMGGIIIFGLMGLALGGGWTWQIIGIALMRGISLSFILSKHVLWIRNRRSRTSMAYIWSLLPLKASIISIISALALINTVNPAGFPCKEITDLLSVDRFITSITPSSQNSLTPGVITDMKRIIKEATQDLFGIIQSQKQELQKSTCDFVNSQLITLQKRPVWKGVAVFLLFIILRPLIGILFRILSFIHAGARQLLKLFKIIKKNTHTSQITTHII